MKFNQTAKDALQSPNQKKLRQEKADQVKVAIMRMDRRGNLISDLKSCDAGRQSDSPISKIRLELLCTGFGANLLEKKEVNLNRSPITP